ncbi:MAG: UDP-N-acetylmuramate--L-alanine ligase [Coriobacteriales bacterium]|jgi:UDP-N-acetylmuramate--alanine ligase|nr:UDP-N-acetylmuramate--L-alanine ligase [Coriobacteriales bacterium]
MNDMNNNNNVEKNKDDSDFGVFAKPDSLKRVHFIGIGGSGMAGLALVAHRQNIKVSGSDLAQTSYMQALLRDGIDITFEHDASTITNSDIQVVVVSTAIANDNAELIAAKEAGIPVWRRAKMLAWLGLGKRVLAVSGTHGKTTTSAMLSTALLELGADPTFFIGGVVQKVQASAHFGTDDIIIAEADESDGSFVCLNPELAIVTNVEADHMDHYESLTQIEDSFRAFLNKLDPDGLAIVCGDEPDLPELARASGRRVLTYGLYAGCDVRLKVLGDSEFAIEFANDKSVTCNLICSPGIHNMLNATAVICALDYLGYNLKDAAQALCNYQGVRRRFELIGEHAGITVVDDYGHHPTEIDATLRAAHRAGYKRVHVLFQPHRYTRTRAFLQDFARAFDAATTISLMPIYAAGELPIDGVNSDALLSAIQAYNPELNVRLLTERCETSEQMATLAKSGDVIITMGAGDVTKEAPLILDVIKRL